MPLATKPGVPTRRDMVVRQGVYFHGTAPKGTRPTLWQYACSMARTDGTRTWFFDDCYGDDDADDPRRVGFTWREVEKHLTVLRV